MESPLVSVVIPAYNAGDFFELTLHSILSQDYQQLEIIVVNDGSVDDTEQVVKHHNDARIRYFYKVNEGVSTARNYGLRKAVGKYVVFFDADDIMSPGFIRSRVEALEKDPAAGFSCGYVLKLDGDGVIQSKEYIPACENPEQQILTFEKDVITCPSNYLFNRSAMNTAGLTFNPRLFSSADKFFLLQVGRHMKGSLVSRPHELYYRVRSGSMSNLLSLNLIRDNWKFHQLVLKDFKPERATRIIFQSKSYYALSGAYWGLRKIKPSVHFGIKAFFMNPVNFISTYLR